jgi:hypothetical protein
LARRGWLNTGLAGLWLVLIAVMVSACGVPQFTYVSNSTQQTYFKVPWDWHKISDKALAGALHSGSSSEPTGVWSVGYDGSSKPSAAHVFGESSTQPFAFALVEPLNSSASSSMSYNELRDLFLPVTSVTRATAAKGGFPLTGFKLLRNDVLTPGQGVHGVHVTFDYTFPDGATDTFDQIAFTNADNTEIYLLVLHCTATCYHQHENEIDTVMSSFTVTQ